MSALYRALLRLYPRRFRRRYQVELVAAFEVSRRDARHQGVSGTVRFWRHIAADLAVTVARLWARQIHSALSRIAGGGTPALPGATRRTEMDTIRQDLRYALRQFVRRPGFTAIAVVSLAIGIGGNSLIYGVIDGYVLHPFPYPDPDRLVAVGVTFPKLSSDTRYVEVLSPAEYEDIKSSRTFAHTAAFDLGNRRCDTSDAYVTRQSPSLSRNRRRATRPVADGQNHERRTPNLSALAPSLSADRRAPSAERRVRYD